MKEHRSDSDEPVIDISKGCKSHLVVMMHGVMGTPGHMKALSKEVEAVLGDEALLLLPSGYSRIKSLRGTEFAGESVLADILKLADEHRSTLTSISLIGYSFGGIVAWWVAGRLMQMDFLGLTPLNFVTVACPLLGAVPAETSSGCLRRLRQQFVANAAARTGAELAHRDRAGLLSWMADPASPFLAGLARFARRSLYANLRGDRTVPFATSYLGGADPAAAALPGDWRTIGDKFPHVLVRREPAAAAAGLAAAAGDGPGLPGDVDAMTTVVAAKLCLLSPLGIVWIVVVWPPLIIILLLFILYNRLADACGGGGGGGGGGGKSSAGKYRGEGEAAPLADGGARPPAGWGSPWAARLAAAGRMEAGLCGLGWARHGVLFTFAGDGLAAVHTHGHIMVRNAIHSAGTDVIRHIADGLIHRRGG